MHKIVTIAAAAVALSAITIAAPTGAQARFGAGAIADAVAAVPSVQPAQYRGGYRSYRPRYSGRGYYDYRRSGYASSRDALDTCAYC
jgi:hypothetical protein